MDTVRRKLTTVAAGPGGATLCVSVRKMTSHGFGLNENLCCGTPLRGHSYRSGRLVRGLEELKQELSNYVFIIGRRGAVKRAERRRAPRSGADRGISSGMCTIRMGCQSGHSPRATTRARGCRAGRGAEQAGNREQSHQTLESIAIVCDWDTITWLVGMCACCGSW